MTLAKFFLPVLLAVAGLCTAAPLTEAGRTAQEAARQYGSAIRDCNMDWAFDCMYPPLKRAYAYRYAGSGNPAAEAEDARRIMRIVKESDAAAQKRMRDNERALRDYYVKMGQAMKAGGFKVESFTVGAPYAEYLLTPPTDMMNKVKQGAAHEELATARDRSRLIVLPTTIVYSMPDRGGNRVRAKRKGYIFAVRDEFISGPVNVRGTILNRWYFVDGSTNINVLRAFFPDLPADIDLPVSGEYPVD